MNSIQCNGERLFPSKVVCIGRNYVAHIEELNNEMPKQPVCFVVKQKKISAVGFGLDLTKRKLQTELKEKGLPWERAKAFDGSAVFSEFKSIPDDIETLNLELHINGELVQKGGCDLMLFKPEDILEDVNRFLTLEDGDVIMTGTPAGVGKVDRDAEYIGKVFASDQLVIERIWNVIPN